MQFPIFWISRLTRSLADLCEYWCNCCGTLFQNPWSNAIGASCFVYLQFSIIVSGHPLLIGQCQAHCSKVIYFVWQWAIGYGIFISEG